MGFQQGLSGLNANSKNLDIIGNNIANSGTYGAKYSRAEFADFYAEALNGSVGAKIGIGVQLATVAQQFTQGNITTTDNPLDVAISGNGFFQVTDDTGVPHYTRNGQFKVNREGYIVNNAGMALLGYGANAAGQIQAGLAKPLQLPTGGVAPEATTKIGMQLNLNSSQSATGTGSWQSVTLPVGTQVVTQGSTQTVTVPAGSPAVTLPDGTPVVTQPNGTQVFTLPANTSVLAQPNGTQVVTLFVLPTGTPEIDFNDPTTYNNATSMTVYDAKGQAVTLTYYFQRISGPNASNPGASDDWNVYVTANGQTVSGTSAAPDPLMTITFAADGSAPTSVWSLTAGSNPNSVLINPSNGHIEVTLPTIQGGPISDGDSNPGNNPLPLPISGIEFDLDVTQFAAAFGITDENQNGFTAGQLNSIGIADDGTVTAYYSNGQTKAAGQIEMATFRNIQGLLPVGDNMWIATLASGEAIAGTPGQASLGVLQAGALEESNVDLTSELVNMITAQRAYQANSQTIKTEDQILQTLVNLR
jgi:flagellar hook protein FlgE